MKRRLVGVALAWLLSALAAGDTTPTPASLAPTPTPAAPGTPAPTAPPEAVSTPAPPAESPTPVPTLLSSRALRIVETPSLPVSTLPPDNPFAGNAETPAGSPPRLQPPKAIQNAALFVAIRVDPSGKAGAARRVRDPIPSVSAESQKSFARWTFEPGRRGGQPVASWAALRLELQVAIDSPRVEHVTVTPISPSTPIPAPLEWGADEAWLDAYPASPPADGAVALEQLDAPPIPRKTPWSADSYKGPFSVRFWIRVGASGRVEKAIPLEASDPVLIPYFRKAMESWTFSPARVQGAPTATWNELALSGQISYSVDIKQISTLRRSL